MEDFRIVIEDNIFVTSYTSTVDTTFFIVYKNKAFPFEQWTDFTFPILEEWKCDMLNYKESSNAKFTLYFHDGPFWLEVFKDDKMELKIDCVNDRYKRRIEETIYCNYYDFLKIIYKSLKTFIKILYKNGMNVGAFSSVYEQLVLSQKELRAILKEEAGKHQN